MDKMAKRPIRKVCVVGSGLIGSGWAARCLARGLGVIATDSDPRREGDLRSNVKNAWPALKRAGLLTSAADPRRLRFTPNLEEAVADADFVQESAPENERLKRRLLARIDAATQPDVIIASSSSGLLPSRIQADCRRPERVLVGHPFNPVYLLPLVEVVGGTRTSGATIGRAIRFYQRLGMRPLKVRTEVPGFISDRLQEALWREALHMVSEGVANTDEIDSAIIYGPGLRWSFMGTCLAFHLAGGENGMQHMLDHFGPALKLPWTKLKAPRLTAELVQRMVDGTRTQAGGRSVKELERWRDGNIIRVMQTLNGAARVSAASRDVRRGKRAGA